MSVSVENKNDIIVYTLESVIAHARWTQQIFVAQCVWWLASIIGLERELVSHIDRLQGQKETKSSEQLPPQKLATPRDLTEDSRVDQVLDSTEQYLRESKRLREEIAGLKSSGITTSGRINPSRRKRRNSRIARGISKDAVINNQKDHSKAEGIDGREISRRTAADECLRCTWPFR